MERARNTGLDLKKNVDLQKDLNQKVFRGDMNYWLENDIRWRAKHLGQELGYWETARSDLPWLLSDGALIMKSPAATKPETNLSLKRQILQDHPQYQHAYITRDSFRCFHRGDGIHDSLT